MKKKKNVRIPGHRRRLLNLDCITFFDILSKQKSNISVLHFYCIESGVRLQGGNLRIHKNIARECVRDKAGLFRKRQGGNMRKRQGSRGNAR